MTAPLAIVVVLYHSLREAEVLWQCLAAQTFPGWTLIAIDNSPTDGAGAYLRGLGDQRITVHANDRNLGFARGVNAGLRLAEAAGARRTVLLNPDVTFAEDFLARLLAWWDSSQAQVIVPRIMLSACPTRAWYAGGGFDRDWLFTNVHFPYRPGDDDPRTVEFASGCCLGLDMGVVRRIGLLDESFFVYWEDSDYCLRLQAAGVPIHYVPDVVLMHDAGASSGGERSAAGLWLFHQGFAVMMRKHFGTWAAMRAVWRTLAVEWRHRAERPGRYRHTAMALLAGMLRRRRPIPRLPEIPRGDPAG